MKRSLDIVLATLGLIALGLPILFLILQVRYRLGRPVFFRQMRPGLHGQPFEMIKFRSMTDACGANGRLLPNAERLTPFGRFLRASSLDEVPELWNVLKGDMSLVGPRPLLMDYLPRYSPEQFRRHEVRPGITGWAQINGRNTLSWEDKFKLDIWYVENHNVLLDLRILILTVKKVIRREGVNASAEVTMPPFSGHGEKR